MYNEFIIFTNIDRRAIVCRGKMMAGDLSGEIVRHLISSGLQYLTFPWHHWLTFQLFDILMVPFRTFQTFGYNDNDSQSSWGIYIYINLGILPLCTEPGNGTSCMSISCFLCLDS